VDQLEITSNQTCRITGLGAGNYEIRVIDKEGCPSEIESFEMLEPDPLLISQPVINPVSCHPNNQGPHADGSFLLPFAGGIGPYRIEVINSAGNHVYSEEDYSENSFQTTETLTPGDYTILVSDRFGSLAQSQFRVHSNPELLLSAKAKDYTCAGSGDGEVLLQIQNNTTAYADFELSGQNPIHIQGDTALFTGLSTGIYQARLTNTLGCSASLQNIVIGGPEPLLIEAQLQSPRCHNTGEGAIHAMVSGGNGGYQYQWSNGESTADISGLHTGYYSLELRDKKGCSASRDFYLVAPPEPTAGLSGRLILLCQGNEVKLDGVITVRMNGMKKKSYFQKNVMSGLGSPAAIP
jgi:hypothetical protein